jgi:DNA-binding HxlR family transcriptional regulator
MAKYDKKSITCPVEQTLLVIGNKWAVLVIRDLLTGKKRFGELLSSLSGISPRTLSLRLTELSDQGILKKKVFYEKAPFKVEYTLSPKGKELAVVLDEMRTWGTKHAK